MNPNQPDLNEMLHSPKTADLLKDRQAMDALLHSDEARRLMELLNQNAGGGLKDAAQSAMKGNAAQLVGLVQGLMSDPHSAKLVEELNKKVQK